MGFTLEGEGLQIKATFILNGDGGVVNEGTKIYQKFYKTLPIFQNLEILGSFLFTDFPLLFVISI